MSRQTRDISFGDAAARNSAFQDQIKGDKMEINIGPSHPATHGVLRLKIEIDGEIITKCDPVIGYLHRGEEKIAECMTYNQFVPYTDRLDYIGPIHNNVTFVLAAEKLAGIEVPARCQAIRVICCELARLQSHLVGLGCFGMDAGALTVFMYTFTEREKIYTLMEELCGARFTTNYTRVGGLQRDIPDGWLGHVLKVCEAIERVNEECDKLLTRNRIFYDRCVGVGVMSKEDAISWNLSGPNARGSGVTSDLRKDRPYLGYENYDFDVPVGTKGDCYDRWLVRVEEVRQSIRIIRQAVDKMPEGLWYNDEAKRIFRPSKDKVLSSMEELIQNFMLVTEGPQLPEGEIFFEAENPKGRQAFFIVSKGGGVPYRLRIHGPSFSNLSCLPQLMVGALVPDIPIILGSLDFVMGDCDR
ncbi:MAG: NADH-quinone oxidoreductase subunit D [Opitutales bacterium]|nr:NADH-quinone oxidoreductase subunit D [Opitutales bacterium]